MSIILPSDIKFVESNSVLLRRFISSRFKFQDRNYMFNIFKTPSYSKLVSKILVDFKRSEQEKMELLMKKLFKGYSLCMLNGSMGEGKGTTSASIYMYAKGHNPQKINYLKKYGVKGIIGLLPCDPSLPFLDGVAWTIDQISEGYAVYIPEMGLVFGNTTGDYNKEDGSQIGKEILKLRQKKSRVLGETQNDSIVNVNFYKFLEQNIYRYMNEGSRKFKREQTRDFSPLYEYLMPPSAVTSSKDSVLDNLTKIFYEDDKGFISVHVPRTNFYTKELSESFSDIFPKIKLHIIKALKDEEPIEKIIQTLELRGVKKSPKFWKEFIKELDFEINIPKSLL